MAPEMPTRRGFVKLTGVALGATMLPLSAGSAVASHPNALFHLDFDTAADAAEFTAASPGWQVDRYAPEAWESDSGRLRINIDETGDTSGFYAYQGKKYLNADGTYWYAGDGSRVSYDFYIDPAWEGDGIPQQSGVWPVLGDANGDINAYPIMEYQDSDASDSGEAGFRAYVYITDEDGNYTGAEWLWIGLPKKLRIDPEVGGWVTVEAQLHELDEGGSALKWRINNKLVLDERDYNYTYDAFRYDSTQFLEFIVNSRNAGVDETYYYDNFALTEPGTAGE